MPQPVTGANNLCAQHGRAYIVSAKKYVSPTILRGTYAIHDAPNVDTPLLHANVDQVTALGLMAPCRTDSTRRPPAAVQMDAIKPEGFTSLSE